MPVSKETINRGLFDALRSLRFDPVSLNSKGDADDDIENADIFRFEYTDSSGTPLGKAWATIENRELVIYTDKDFTSNANFEKFAIFMKNWAQRRLLDFKITDKENLQNDMKKRTVMKKKETLGEGYYPMGKKASYNDAIPQVKIILQHTRQLEEGEQRFRNIARIFVENTNGERFLLPTNRPGLARVYARHIAEGGTPYDDKGRHVTSLVEEYQKMAGFVRATRNGQFNESALRLVNEGLNHYNNLRLTLQGMTSHRGYTKYFENYTPVLNEETDDETSLNELFVQETLDPRIESVMPILKRLSKNITEMSEVNELAEWAESILEVEDETTKTLAEPADEMLEEVDTGEYDARKTTPSSKEKQEKVFAKHRERMKNLDEAPGAETLAHNQSTEKSNLKAFDLDEGFSPSEEVADQIVDSLGGESDLTSDDVYRAVEEYQSMMDSPHKLDIDEVVQIVMDKMNIEELGEAFRYYYPGATKAEIKNKVKKFIHGNKGFEEDVSEDLDADQKRVGQLGPTEKVGPKGAVGKLVGASESVEMDRLKALSGIK